MNKAVVVSGEASETDSEDEHHNYSKDIDLTKSVQGILITGEDSESENESSPSVASAVSALDQFGVKQKLPEDEHKSLLLQKLRDNNAQLHFNLENFCQNTVNEANKHLTEIDQHLIRSQVTLQNAVTSLKALNSNSSLIKNKLHSMLSANFLFNVKSK